MIPRSDEEAEAQRLYTLSQATQLGTAEPGLEPGHSGSGSFSSTLLRGSERQAWRDVGQFPGLRFPGHAPWTSCLSIVGEQCHGCKFLAPPRLTELELGAGVQQSVFEQTPLVWMHAHVGRPLIL